jgi:hypothetical protein
MEGAVNVFDERNTCQRIVFSAVFEGKSSGLTGRGYFIRNTSFGSGKLILEKADDASQATGCAPLFAFLWLAKTQARRYPCIGILSAAL